MPTHDTPPLLAGVVGASEQLDRDELVTLTKDNAPSEEDAATPPETSLQIVLSLLQRCWRACRERRERYRLRVTLESLSERELTDIGMTRAEIEHIVAHRSLDQLRHGITYPWMR
jgi:uncharacterized protein YjiS (DUF1127 family)